MALLKTLGLFVFTVGILSSANAKQGRRRGLGFLIPPHILGFVNTTAADVEKFDEEMCTKNSGPGAYEAHKESWEHLSTCLAAVNTEVGNEAYSQVYPLRNPSFEIFFDKYCRRVSNYENCFQNITESMKTCLDPEKHESVNIIYNTISSVMQFSCAEGTPRMTMTELQNAERCAYSERAALLACANQTVIKYIHETIPNGAAVGGLGAVHLLVPDNNKCTIIEKFERCVVDILKNCLPPKILRLENSVFKLVKKVTTCDRWLKSQASTAHVVNLSLITAVMAFYL